jgi:predicted neuraminidase
MRRLLPAICVFGLLAVITVSGPGASAPPQPEKPFHSAELIFPLDPLHNHSSCVVECPNGDLLVCWYRGSGERTADDVAVLGARRSRRTGKWSAPFVMADVPGFPDCNPCMLIDPQKRLWLFWVTIQANEWHTALLMSKASESFQGPGAPRWSREKGVHLKPGPEFTQIVQESADRDLRGIDRFPAERRDLIRAYLQRRRANAADKYFMRLGWMPRPHPVILDGTRMIVPLYSDGFDFSLMAITDDWGETWHTSAPIVGDGPVQPAIAKRRDGSLVAYMRDNGLPPKRLLVSESKDRGETWTPPRDLEVFNPGAGVDVANMSNGHWVMVNNDTERDRHSLLVSISDDEGKSWRWNRHLELDRSDQDRGGYSYPSVMQASDGTLHVTYTYAARPSATQKDSQGRNLRSSIRHVQFNEAWVRAGD